MKHFGILILIFIIGQSCDKVGPTATTVKGTVIDVITNEPIAGISIKIAEYDYSLSGLGGGRDIAVLETNEEGVFEDSFSTKELKRYKCFIGETPNIAQGLGNADNIIEDIIKGQDNIIEFKIAFAGYIKEGSIWVSSCDQ